MTNFKSILMMLILTSLLPAFSSNAKIEKYGVISADETWSGNILVTGDVLVEEGVTLTILPGTQISITAHSDNNNLWGYAECEGIPNFDLLQGINNEYDNKCGVHRGEPYRDEGNHISIAVIGTIYAVGEPDHRIIIKSTSEEPTIYDWNRLDIWNGVLSYVTMQDYRILGVHDETAGNVAIKNCVLSNIGECGICANSNNVLIDSNEISYAGHELIDMHLKNPTIIRNTLGPNPEHAGIVIDAGNPAIIDNHFVESESGIGFIDVQGLSSSAVIRYNTFDQYSPFDIGCSQATITNNNIYSTFHTGFNCTYPTITVSNNFWGTTSESEIEDRIFDSSDDPNARQAIYTPFLDKPANITWHYVYLPYITSDGN